MPYNFTASDDFFTSQKNITTLVKFAREQDRKGNQDNRNLFLKLSVVTLVTRFQVYVESVLKEFDFKIKQTNKVNRDIPLHFRLNSIKIETSKKPIHVRLENPTEYNAAKFTEINTLIALLNNWCDDNNIIHPDLKFETKYPLGAQGLSELKKLFKQIDGKDIFSKARFDIEKLNEILRRRHDIIHEDNNQQLTELSVTNYKKFMGTVVKFIDRYLNKIIA